MENPINACPICGVPISRADWMLGHIATHRSEKLGFFYPKPDNQNGIGECYVILPENLTLLGQNKIRKLLERALSATEKDLKMSDVKPTPVSDHP